jgi:SNF2 family DNA or RNA helicase
MFLQIKPNAPSDNNEESNENIIANTTIPMGTYELAFNITSPILGTQLDTNPFPYKFKIDPDTKKMHLTHLTGSNTTFNVNLIESPYTLFTMARLDYLSNDEKFFSKFVEIIKSPYIVNRYMVKISLFLNKNTLDEVYNILMEPSVTSLKLKDVFTFSLMHDRSVLELKMDNITNTDYGEYTTTNTYDIKPFKYQLQNVNWCKNVESNLNKIESVEIMKGYDDKYKLDTYCLMNNNILYLRVKNIEKPEAYNQLKYFYHIQGGLLCDNMGLGKTLTLTVHITDDSTKINDICIERGKMLQEYKTSLNETTNVEMYDHMDAIKSVIDDEYKMLFGTYKLKTNCNLLIVPVRLLQQWDSEIKKYFSKAKIYLINTIRDFNKLNLEDIEKYQIMIIPITFLQNTKRTLHPEGYNLQDVFWKRVIVDEVHELFTPDANSRRTFTAINEIKAAYKWGISGTPNLNSNCESMLTFLTNNIYYVNQNLLNFSRWYKVTTDIKDYWNFINKYYRYNEQKKVNTEIYIPEYEENIVELDMSNIEKLLYNNATGDNKRMIALCTNYKISSQDSVFSGFATVSELKDKMLEQHNKKRQEHMDKIDAQKKTNGYIKELIDWFYTDRNETPEHIRINYPIITGDFYMMNINSKDQNVIADTIDRVTKKLETNEKVMVQLEKELKLIKEKEAIINNFNGMIEEKLNDPCMICFGNFDSAMITECNHMYCGNCVNEMFKNTQQIKCPMCRHPLTRQEINAIVDKNLNMITGDDIKKRIETKEEEKVNMTNGGTKINAILEYVKACKGKIIVFATEKVTLDLIGDVLEENKIKYVNLKGNAYVVSKQLKRFKNGEENVILLSADRANSGTNLIEASHIILLDTHLITDVKSKKDVEKQAIGRAVRLGQKNNVKVMRFIMKNTIEQVMLNKN